LVEDDMAIAFSWPNSKLTEGVSSISMPKILPLMFGPVVASQW
jgi:hypothetical protein